MSCVSNTFCTLNRIEASCRFPKKIHHSIYSVIPFFLHARSLSLSLAFSASDERRNGYKIYFHHVSINFLSRSIHRFSIPCMCIRYDSYMMVWLGFFFTKLYVLCIWCSAATHIAWTAYVFSFALTCVSKNGHWNEITFSLYAVSNSFSLLPHFSSVFIYVAANGKTFHGKTDESIDQSVSRFMSKEENLHALAHISCVCVWVCSAKWTKLCNILGFEHMSLNPICICRFRG